MSDARASAQSRAQYSLPSASITVGEAGALWLAQAESDGLEASTVTQYRQHLTYHIAPFLGDIKLAELTPTGVKNFRDTLIREGRSRVMVKKVTTSLGAILAEAMSVGQVARNVVHEQTRATAKRRQRVETRHKKELEVGVDIPNKDELRAILAHAQGRWRPLIVTAVFTGLRASELRGLRWSDIEFDRGVLTVRQRADRANRIGSPKSNSSKREVSLAPMVVNALKERQLACPKGETNLVFPNRKGDVLCLTDIHRLGLRPLQVVAGIAVDRRRPKYGLHALRHAAASLLIEQGSRRRKSRR